MKKKKKKKENYHRGSCDSGGCRWNFSGSAKKVR